MQNLQRTCMLRSPCSSTTYYLLATAYPLLLDGLAVVRHQVLGHGVAGHVLLHHVQVLRRLEAIDHPHDVGVVALDEALALARAVEPPPG